MTPTIELSIKKEIKKNGSITKKKRGRPRKSRTEDTMLKNSGTEIDNDDEYSQTSSISKKKAHKNKLRKTSFRHIPKEILEDTLDILNNENHEIWEDKNVSCNPSINQYYDEFRAGKLKDCTFKLKCARECLLRRDWKSLFRFIATFITEDSDMLLYAIYARYAAIALAYNDLEKFKQFIRSHDIMDEKDLIQTCTTIKRHSNRTETVQIKADN